MTTRATVMPVPPSFDDPAWSVYGHCGDERHYSQSRGVDDSFQHHRAECLGRIQVLAPRDQIGADRLTQTRRQDRVSQIPHQ